MNRSFRIGAIAGIDIRVHVTLPLFLLILGGVESGLSGWSAGGEVLVGLTCLFGFVLLHELGHSLVARAFGIRVASITLLPFGGVAAATRIPRTPAHEILIAVAGPAVNLVLAGVIAGIMWLSRTPLVLSEEVPLLTYLLLANIALLCFNLIPAFPLDGGRVLRAVLATRLPYVVATRWAARIGLIFSCGFLGIVIWKPRMFMLGVIALFLYFAGRRETRNAEFEEIARHRFVGDHLRAEPWYAAERGTSIGEVCAVLSDTPEMVGCVVDLEGFMYALLDRRELLAACLSLPHYLRIHKITGDASRPLRADMPLGVALPRLRHAPGGRLPVIAADGEIVGLAYREDIEAAFPAAFRARTRVGGRRR